MYYECTECGQMGDYVGREHSRIRTFCPVCDRRTGWRIAFSDEGEGVSF